jgi:hypothetical protein
VISDITEDIFDNDEVIFELAQAISSSDVPIFDMRATIPDSGRIIFELVAARFDSCLPVSDRPVGISKITTTKRSPRSGRLKIAQQFTAGIPFDQFKLESVKRTTEVRGGFEASVVRFTDSVSHYAAHPSSELLGYCQPSAART